MSSAQKRIHEAALKLFAQQDLTAVNVSDLAQMAGVARGTIYNNLPSTDQLFETVAGELTAEMQERIDLSFLGEEDPARRLANGVRLYTRRAHQEPHWGRFLTRYALSSPTMRRLWDGSPVVIDLANGLAQKRFRFRRDQLSAAVMMTAGTVLACVFQVVEGLRTWREAGSDSAELLLIALGIDPKEARAIATEELPPLVELANSLD